MAVQQSVIPFTGKLGSLVGFKLKGKYYVRKAPQPSKKEPSQAQLATRAKFLLVQRFIYSMNNLLNKTCTVSRKRTGSNTAFSYAFRNMVKGMYPDYALDYSQAMISQGPLHNATCPTVSSSAAGFIHFCWMSNCQSQLAYASDMAVLVAYCEETGITEYHFNAAPRSAGWAMLDVRCFSGKKVHTWLAFRSEDGKTGSNSMYTGMVEVR